MAGINLKQLSSLEYIDNFYNAVFALTRVDFSFDISEFDTLEEGHQALRKYALFQALKVYGNYSIINDGFYDNGDKLQIGCNRFLLELKQLVLDNDIEIQQSEDIKNDLFNILFSDTEQLSDKLFSSTENIPFEKIVFLLYEYTYKSSVHTAKYNFDGLDIRRNVLGRVEISTINKYYDYKLHRNNFKHIFLDMIENFNIPIKQGIATIVRNKEVEYRTDLLNKVYFNFEHFLSEIVEHFTITRTDNRKKQTLLLDVLEYFDINDELVISDVSDDILSRCDESKELFEPILNNSKSTKVKMTDIFLRIITMRNSLHSNGFINRDENHLSIGKLRYKRNSKGFQHNSMTFINVIMLFTFMIYILEKIIDKSYEKISNELIEDKYLKELKEIEEETT